eukprot:Phypoly_transcript_15577.p1 GENE.Phypoly_transcript_15577~~Phypoly_transcript_15577.p1  ORF type:complete len:211 (-),score=4.10 Phypoly_transcript_15577:85-717(-)
MLLDTELRQRINWRPVLRECFIVLLLSITLLLVLHTIRGNQTTLQDALKTKMKCMQSVDLPISSDLFNLLTYMEGRVTLFLSISWVVLQWAIVVSCLVIFYPLKVLFRKPTKTMELFRVKALLPIVMVLAFICVLLLDYYFFCIMRHVVEVTPCASQELVYEFPFLALFVACIYCLAELMKLKRFDDTLFKAGRSKFTLLSPNPGYSFSV